MAPNHLFNDNPPSGNSQARPRFSWPDLRKAIEVYARERLCYLPAAWGRKKPSVNWEEYQNRLPTIAEKVDWFHEGKKMILEVGTYSKVSAGRIIADMSSQRKERLLEELVLRRLVAEFVGRSYNKVLFSYAVRKLQGRVR